MLEISFLLDRFKKISLPDETIRMQAAGVIEELLGVRIDIKHIVYKKGELVVSVDSVIRNELFIKRNKLQKELVSRLGEKAPKKIR